MTCSIKLFWKVLSLLSCFEGYRHGKLLNLLLIHFSVKVQTRAPWRSIMQQLTNKEFRRYIFVKSNLDILI